MKIHIIFIAYTLFIIYGAHAATLTDSVADTLHNDVSLDEIVVTATRTPKTLKDVPVQTRLITSEEIRRSDATDLQDLLQTCLPGVEFSYAMNQQVNMNLSGFAGQSLLVLVDGERLAGETMDNVDFSRLSMAGVERVEIVKGAASALYGSNAAGGVINIITKQATKQWQANISGRYGSHNEWRLAGDASFKHKRVAASLTAGIYGIDTYHVCTNRSDECDFRQCYGYRTVNVCPKLVYRPSDRLALTARAGYYFKQRLYNPDIPDRYRDFSAGLRAQWRISDHSDIDVSYAFDQYDKSDYLRTLHLDVRDYRNVVNTLRALYNHQFGTHTMMTIGGDLANDYLDTYQFAGGSAHRQTNADVFIQADWTVNRHWELIGALRYDYFSSSHDSRLTTKLNACYKARRLTLRAGYAQGFRAPTLKERYMDFDMAGIFDIHGNRALRAETSHNFNASAEYSVNGYNIMVGATYSIVGNKISTSAVRYGSEGQPYLDHINVPDLQVFGLEATAQKKWSCGLSASLSYAYTHEQTRTSGIEPYCPARPHSLHASLAWGKRWNRNYTTDISLTCRLLSAVSYNSMYMYEPFDIKRITNPAYAIGRLHISQTVAQHLCVSLTVDNLFNYRPSVYSFNTPTTDGTAFQFGISYNL